MKRTLILLVLFALLGFGVYQYLQGSQERGTADGSFEKQFAVENIDEIHKIFLADRKGNQATLERSGDHWMFDGKYKARPTAIENLLDAVKRVRVKYRPAKNAEKHMVENLSTSGTKVELYNKAGEKIKCYYVGGSTHDAAGTFMILENSNEPLVAHIPRFVGNLQVRYGLVGDEWRDRNVFGEKPEEIQSVSIEYPDPAFIQNSFIIERQSRYDYTVKPLFATTPVIEKPVQNGKVESFFVKFETKIVEAIENLHPDREQIVQQIPFCTLTLKTIKGKEKRVKFFPIYPENNPVQDKDGNQMLTSGNVFRYHAQVNEEDFVLVQQGVFGELFWSYESFF